MKQELHLTQYSRSKDNYWEKINSDWSSIGYPLRPSTDDVKIYARLMLLPRLKPVTALILGVTPELYHIDWPDGSVINSAEKSQGMIDAVWPGSKADVYRCDWLDIPCKDGTYDFVLLDGGLSLLEYPASQEEFSHSIQRVLKPGGLLVTRAFAMPETPDRPDRVLADLRIGQIPNINVLKLYLGMSLVESPEKGVQLAKVYQVLENEVCSMTELSTITGWTAEVIATIMLYKESKNTYYFTSERKIIEILTHRHRLAFQERAYNNDLFGGRCPILSFVRL